MPTTSAEAICMTFRASRTTCGTFVSAASAEMPPPPAWTRAALARVSGVRCRTLSAHFMPPFFRKAKEDAWRSVR